MKHHISRRTLLLAVIVLLTGAVPAFAEISVAPYRLPQYPSARNAVAFDSVNQVYLMTHWQGNPLTGQFLDRNGAPVGGAFYLATAAEGTLTAWPQVAFGGPPSDPVFLVTYLGVSGSSYVKYGRLVRFAGGAVQVGGAIPLVDTLGQWQAAEKAQTVWFGDHFIVATRILVGGLAQPVVQSVWTNGAASGAVPIGDGLDFEGSATLACAPSGTCLATGFAGGYPFNFFGGAVFARLFNANTLQPESGLFYLDDHTSRMDDPWVVFNPVTGQFLTVWWQASYAQFRTVSTTGALGSYDHRFGDWAGDIALKFNAATGTALLTSKWRNTGLDPSRWADLYAVEIDSNFQMMPVVISPWDGSWPEFWPSIAADERNGRWLVTSFETAGGRGTLVFAGGGGGGGGGSTQWDFNGDGARDVAVYRSSSGEWFVHNQFSVQWGWPGDVPVAGDYNGDGVTDIAVWRPSTGVWHVRNLFSVQWGLPGDVPVPGDYNGDGITDIAVWRPSDGTWYVRNVYTVQFGWPEDVPVPGDYNGDGATDVAVRRPSSATWYVLNQFALQWGLPTDMPVPGDYNGDGVTDLALYRPGWGEWHVLNQFAVQWGWPDDVPVPGDYNGDGVTDVAVWRPSNGTWHVRGQFALQFGWASDTPIGGR